MSTVFTKIINGEIPGTFVYRDDHCVVFMSINPMAPGHALVIPKAEIEHWIDVPAPLLAHLFEVSHRIARAQEQAFDCEKIGMIIAGYEVPHTHIHLVPTTDMSQLSFANAAASVDPADLEAWAASIRTAMSTLD